MRKAYLILYILLAFVAQCFAQQAQITGFVKDSLGKKIPDVNITVVGIKINAFSDDLGSYKLTVPANQELVVVFSYVGQTPQKIKVNALKPGQVFQLNIFLDFTVNLTEFNFVQEQAREQASTTIIDIKDIKQLPNVSGSFEQILKTLPGVTSNNELSSQYNVRGGNYDENLVYVNDIEIYRPFLPRSGQQEGLSFIHTELVQNVKFSAGGFEARYGDKMSSVLDVKYKSPKKFASSVNLNLMGAQAHAEGSTKNLRFTYLLGARYWSNQYVLSSLDVEGDYQPKFADVQTLLSYHFTDNLSLSVLGSYAHNKYLVVPQTRETVFGTVSQALQLTMYFEGQDLMEYKTATGAFTLNYQPSRLTQLKLIGSAFNSNEREFFTVEGAYRLEEVETDFGSDNFGKAKATKGIGYFLNHARNRIDAKVYNIGHRGYHTAGKNNLQWGIQFQTETISDYLNEWDYRDSAGFSQPSQVNGMPAVLNYLNTQLGIQSHRLNGYIQNNQMLNSNYNWVLTYGVRSSYWSYNNQNVLSPRIQMSFEPNKKYNRTAVNNGQQKLKRDISLKAAWGYYYQPPFYRELRSFDGKLNPNIKAQLAIHYVLGGDLIFNIWNRKFKFMAEAYYKKLENLIPYEIDNVRIRYFADNIAKGYATGIDFRINGEFVKGAESWMSLSFMKTQETIPSQLTYDVNGNQIGPTYVPRQTDQRATFSMFFQDYLRKNDKYKVNFTMVFGAGLPFGPPDENRYNDTLRIPAYKRVDIGFLRVLVDEKDKNKTGIKKHIKSAWVGLDVFNLLDIDNTISYIWIEDIEGRTWAVPNYLTSRRVNIRLQVYF